MQRKGYAGFGSFHSDISVEDMIAGTVTGTWKPPANPCQAALPPPSLFGREMRPQFLIDFASWCFINHGAFGGPLRYAQQEAAAWRERCEMQPLKFIDRELFPQLVRVLKELATLLGCSPADLALLPNATTGLNTVLAAWRGRLKPDDAVFSLDIGYGSVKKMIQVLCESTGAQAVQAQMRFPLAAGAEREDLLRQVADAMPSKAKLAVFDAVTSNTAVVLPLAELVMLCHSRGVEVVIDGAHAMGMLPLNLEHLGADAFVANCHKWLCAPRGSACMWVHPKHRSRVRPLIVSHGYGGGFSSEFIWDGCRDYAPLLAVSAALTYWFNVPGGWDAVRAYQQQLLQQAVELLAQAWGAGSRGSDISSDSSGTAAGGTLVPLSMCGSMALVRLPPSLLVAAAAAGGEAGQAGNPTVATSMDAKWVQDSLHFLHGIEVPIKCVGGQLYVRISAHVYNELPDYQRLAEAVLALAAEAGNAAADKA